MEDGVYAIAGAKGGVGKTTTTLAVAAALADRGLSVAAVELDLAMANACDFLGIDDEPDVTLHDVLAGDAAVESATVRIDSNLTLLPSGMGLEGFAETSVGSLSNVVDALREEYDVVLLDTGAGVSQEMIEPIRVADATILVTTPRKAATRDAQKTGELADNVDSPVEGVIVTRSAAVPDAEAPPADVAAHLGADLLGAIPNDPAVPAAQEDGTSLVTHDGDAPAVAAYEHVADVLVGDADPGPGEAHETAAAALAAANEGDAGEASDADEQTDASEASDAGVTSEADATSEVDAATNTDQPDESTAAEAGSAAEDAPDAGTPAASADEPSETEEPERVQSSGLTASGSDDGATAGERSGSPTASAAADGGRASARSDGGTPTSQRRADDAGDDGILGKVMSLFGR